MKKYQIKIVSNTDNLELYGYPNQLIQCFINLFNNSKDAFLENNIPEEDRYIFITNYISNKNVIIEFKDSANGIPTTVIDKIFTPYFTTKEDEKGTGLGLYMTQDLIKKGMGGTIEISNESYIYNNKELKGAKFKITIPINIEL